MNAHLTPRQQQYAARRQAGQCTQCGEPSKGRVHCDECARRAGHAKRRPLKAEWEAVDWTEHVDVIAKRMGVTPEAAYRQRKKYVKEPQRSPSRLRSHRMRDMLVRCAEHLEAIEAATIANPAQAGKRITQAQDELGKFIREEISIG